MKIPFKDAWHEDASQREGIGTKAEGEFQTAWLCGCGGTFERHYPGKKPGSPDFSCKGCGKLVEIKSATKKTDAVSISKIPFDNYPKDTVIAYFTFEHVWIGVRRGDAIIKSGPHQPAHTTNPTWYYWISLRNFTPLQDYGFINK